MSDIQYNPEICRNISVDIRYVLFIIDKLAGASHLIDEMVIVDWTDKKPKKWGCIKIAPLFFCLYIIFIVNRSSLTVFTVYSRSVPVSSPVHFWWYFALPLVGMGGGRGNLRVCYLNNVWFGPAFSEVTAGTKRGMSILACPPSFMWFRKSKFDSEGNAGSPWCSGLSHFIVCCQFAAYGIIQHIGKKGFVQNVLRPYPQF